MNGIRKYAMPAVGSKVIIVIILVVVIVSSSVQFTSGCSIHDVPITQIGAEIVNLMTVWKKLAGYEEMESSDDEDVIVDE